MKINIHKEVEIESTIRTELLSSMFEVPAKTKLSVSLTGDLSLDDKPWNVGLIVGPSGSGKTLVLNETFGIPQSFDWSKRSVIDDFPELLSMEDISRVCQSVGFNTIPSWLRPYSVLSNGERFRVETARHLLGNGNPVVIDEFTSVVDRQVAQFACHSIQRYVRERKKRLVVASCHYDIIDWLQPDWILEPGNPCRFTWRSLRARPLINVAVSRVKYETWQLFKDFHYMSQDLNKAARCYGLFVKSAECTAGLGIGLYDDDFYSSKDENKSNLAYGTGSRFSSAGYYGSGGGRTEDSRLLVRTGRSEAGHEYLENESARCYDSDNTSGVISTKNLHNELAHGNEISSVSRRPNGSSTKIPKTEGSYRIASMCGVLYRPHPKVSDICGFTRMVTLPDFQGLGLAFVLACKVASAYKAVGKRLHSYPNHPAWIRSYQRSSLWMQVKDSGSYSPKRGSTSTVGGFGGKRCAVFQYIGDAMNIEEARRLINGD